VLDPACKLSSLAEQRLRVGTPVSAGWNQVDKLERVRARGVDVKYTITGDLSDVSIVHRGAVPGAEVTSIIRHPRPRAAPQPTRKRKPQSLFRDFGEIVAVR
jgi:hypothetical protein